MPLTPRQQRALQFIKRYISSNGQAPTLREIADFVGYSSVSGTHWALKDLERRGLIKRNRDRSWRDLEVLEPAQTTSKLTCGKCYLSLPIGEFGICRSRQNGRNLYCRSCIRKTVYEGRDRVRRMKANRKAAQERISVDRKCDVMSPTIGTALNRVRQATRAGYHTREAIQEITGLPMDHLCDALAILSSERELQFARVEGEAHFYPVNGTRVFVPRAA